MNPLNYKLWKNKGCTSCQHFNIGKINLDKPDTEHNCGLGKNKELKQWWEENKHQKIRTELTSMPCYEETELGNILNKMSSTLNKIKELLER
ncbi:MAG: hypothetical protein ABIP51_20145 [Bacteroidia bacterium]